MDGQRGLGGASRCSGGRGEPPRPPTTSVGSANRRWVPPSSIKRDAITPEERNDIVFRKVRGILNKLTPEKFLKLSEELIATGLESTQILKGVILLIFDKALDEPKYSSMYAQLCRKLCEEAPNFEPPTNSSSNNNTFRRLLLAKCQDEFENRKRASEEFDKKDGRLTSEEEEQRSLAKHKMLGNIKFIGELGKQGLLQESILHKCIKQLLCNKKRQSIKDVAEDLECLCQIMKTVGQRLDTEKAKPLMDQYFGRIKFLASSSNCELPSRIRFMLQDVVELRENKWIPRKAMTDHGPKTIQQIREEAARDYGIFIPHPMYPLPTRNAPGMLMPVTGSGKGRGGLDDVFSPMPLGVGSLGTGPGVIPTDNFLGYSSNMGRSARGNMNPGYLMGGNDSRPFFTQSRASQGRDRDRDRDRDLDRDRDRDLFSSFPQQNRQQSNPNQNQTAHGFGGSSGSRDLPPRFMKKVLHQQANNVEEISLRPALNSIVQKPKTAAPFTKNPNTQNNVISGMGPVNISNNSLIRDLQSPSLGLSSNSLSNPLQKEAPIVIKQTVQDKNKTNKQGPSKEEVLKKSEDFMSDLLNTQNVERAACAFRDLKAPKKYQVDVLVMMMVKALEKSESDREIISQFIVQLKKENLLAVSAFVEAMMIQCSELVDSRRLKDATEIAASLHTICQTLRHEGFSCKKALKKVYQHMVDLEAEVPRVKSYAAGFAARGVVDELATLAEIAEPLEGGVHYPLFLLCLQHLHRSQGRTWLIETFNQSKVNLLSTLPEMDRTKERLADILEDRGLSFLFPLLRIQADLWKQVQVDPSPNSLYRWVKENVDVSQHSAPGFINALVSCLVKYITQETTLASNVDRNATPDKMLQDKEKELLEKFKGVFRAFLNEHVDLQLTALYALQVHCHNNRFPKGMLLRWFMMLYDLEIVEEEAFLKWKEDVNDEYPGKGNALFQVNQWLTWLEEAEEEEGSDDGGN